MLQVYFSRIFFTAVYGHNFLLILISAFCLQLAGAVIVSEAGGIVLDPSGKEFDIMSRRILVASTQKLVDEWKNQIDYQTPKFERDFPEICPM